MLSVDQLIDLEILTQEELQRLLEEEAKSAADVAPISPDKAIGRLSRLDSMQIQEIAKDAQRRREKRIQDLKRALERMDAGSFGMCERCSQWIDFERLEAQPEALICGQCGVH
ncbi:MAG: DnaK suppressor protein [Verrucomicrobiales bacterium]|jgi:DnaK suppressor protein